MAAALGLAAARAGKRTIVCEVAEQEQITRAFGKPAAGFNETEVAENLHTFSINPDDAKQEWLKHQLRSGALAGLLSGSRIFEYLTAAAPGLAEIVTFGKVWELAQLDRRTPRSAPYDLVILDAPADRPRPRTDARAAHVRGRRQGGPIDSHAKTIERFITDPATTAIVAVALAEEMPVNETIELEGKLRDELGMDLSALFANGAPPERFSVAEAEAMASVDGVGSAAARAALEAALAAHERASSQRSQVAG